MNWAVDLQYLSGGGLDGVFGKGFNYPQNLRLEEQDNGDVVLWTGQNTQELFEKSGDEYVPAPDNNTRAVLTRDGVGANDEFTLTSSKGVVTKFYGFDAPIVTPGRIKSITDRFGSVQSYTWSNSGGIDQLTSVADSYGRTMTYRYYGSEQQYRLKEIEDFLGRKVSLQFDGQGHLVGVVLPSILRGAEGNTFPGGTGYVFQYDVNNPRPERRDDLIRVWYPNEVAPYLDNSTRTIGIERVYADAVPRYTVEYGQDPTDTDLWGRVVAETVGDPSPGAEVGGTYQYLYVTNPLDLPANIIDPTDPIVFRCVVTDRNGNQTVYDFNSASVPVRVEVISTRHKSSLEASSFVTWTKYNENNQPLLIVYPEGNSREYEYETGDIPGLGSYTRRKGLLIRETTKPGNTIGIPSRSGSNGQTELTRRYFHDPIFNQRCASIERRGNPVASGSTYFTPQNGGTTPTDSDRSRYATVNYFDYQKNTDVTITGDPALQSLLGLDATQIQTLIDYVNDQMVGGGLPDGFERDLGDVNGDGTGDGASSGLPAAVQLGNRVKIGYPSVRLIGASAITTQVREVLFTSNSRGQVTTRTDPEGNLTVYVRYPFADPEGDGQFVSPGLGNKQYGRMKEIHADADPNDVMSLVGSDGDLVDFVPGKIDRTNTPGVYQDLVTRYEGGGGGGGCSSCAYDPLGNPLAVTDARGFTTRYERNELGEIYRTVSPLPFEYKIESYYDANRNIVRVDAEDRVVAFASNDPTSADYAKFVPSGSGTTAQFATEAGPGGAVRPGWFTNLYKYDLLDNLVEQDMDATGSTPSSLVTTHQYDPNQNLIQTTKPARNTIQYDYDERNLRIAERVGYDPDADVEGAVTVWVYDGNGNLATVIGPAQRGGAGTSKTVVIADAFRSGTPLTHTGDWLVENTYDGFDRLIESVDAVGNVNLSTFDPDGRVIESNPQGPVGGATPTNRNGTANVDLRRSYTRFDEAGRAYENQQDVFLGSGTTLPSARSVTHTGGGLATNSTANDHTGTVTLTSAGSSYVLTRNVYDRASRLSQTIQDNTAVTSTDYDGASRRITQTDPLGNRVDYGYDGNSNVTAVTRTEKCTITEPTVADEVFRSAMFYDSLNRLVVQANQGADGTFDLNWKVCCTWPVQSQTLFTMTGYDSRGNRTLAIDPKGNTTVTDYDGASRVVMQVQHLRQNGQGDAPPALNATLEPHTAGSITTTTIYDANSRVTQLIDDRGGTTTYEYDTLDRQTAMIFHDGSTRSYVYDDADDVVTYTDENGSVFSYTFDPIGRRTACAITLASGVVGTTAQSFQYDGLSRMTLATDTASSEADVTLVYDSTGRVLEDSQTFSSNTRNVTNTKFTSYPATQFTYPNNRNTTNTYDALYRRTQVSETTGGTNIASWQFFGPSRTAEVTLGNGLICTWMNNARTHSAVQEDVDNPAWGDQSSDRLGYDGSGRMITKRFLAGGIDGTTHAYNDPTAIVGFTTAFDRASNKFYERHLHAESRSHLYQPFASTGEVEGGYDSLNRLRQYQRGVLDSTGGSGGNGGGSVVTPISLPNTDTFRDYDLDGLGNWRRTEFEPVGGSDARQIRQHNKLNQITSTKDDSDPAVAFAYDGATGHSNGNLTNDGIRTYQWDALNRLITVKRKSDNATIATYTYDALNRRIRKVITNGGLTGDIPNGTTDSIFNTQWQCMEERDASNTGTKQYNWGTYIDECVQQKNVATINNLSGNLYPLQDLLYRTTGLADNDGVTREAYDTDAYGNTIIFRNAGNPPAEIAFDDTDTQVNYPTCDRIFTGQVCDAETEIYCYRRRYYSTDEGRFIGRDLLLYRFDLLLYGYVREMPSRHVDPFGAAGKSPVFPDWGEHVRTTTFQEDATVNAMMCVLNSVFPASGLWTNGINDLAASGRLYVGDAPLRTDNTVAAYGETKHGAIIVDSGMIGGAHPDLIYGPAILAHEYTHFMTNWLVDHLYNDVLEATPLSRFAAPTWNEMLVQDRLAALDNEVTWCCDGNGNSIQQTKLQELYCNCGFVSECVECI